MRLFFGLSIPEDQVRPLQLIQERLPQGARYSLATDFHVTFKFLGDIDASQALEVGINARSVIKRTKFTPEDLMIKYSKLDVFHWKGRPHVVHVKLKLSPKLYQFQKDLEMALEPLGFAVSQERFVPHVTLARLREFDWPVRHAWEAGFKMLGVQKREFEVSHLNLFESHMFDDKPTEYSALDKLKFVFFRKIGFSTKNGF